MMGRRRLVFLGPPASGKGTQTALIFDKYGIPTMSTGTILRKEIEMRKAEKAPIEDWLRTGGLAPDAVVLQLVLRWLDAHDSTFLFDGFPRTLIQAKSLDEELDRRQLPIDAAVQLDLSDDEIFERVLKRLTCTSCGKTFASDATQNLTRCPECHGELVRRNDDNKETLSRRLSEYHEKTEPVLDYYSRQNKLFRVDAAKDRQTVFSALSDIIEGGGQ